MPLRKHHSSKVKIIIWLVAIVLVALMLVYFPPAQNVTEVVLYQ